jgi:hypothetical protein
VVFLFSFLLTTLGGMVVMQLKSVHLTWQHFSKMPSPLKFSNAKITPSSHGGNIKLDFDGLGSHQIRETYRQIQIWLLDGRCTFLKLTYAGSLPEKDLIPQGFVRTSTDGILRKEIPAFKNLRVAAIPVIAWDMWYFSVMDRDTKIGVPIEACDMTFFNSFSYQLTIDAEGQVLVT